jgi:hypothetical protein
MNGFFTATVFLEAIFSGNAASLSSAPDNVVELIAKPAGLCQSRLVARELNMPQTRFDRDE